MAHKITILAVFFCAILLQPSLRVHAADSLPNIVVIVADDLGWGDVSFHGSEIKTPNIDRLAREGVELDRFYVCPVCSPTRAGLMTGRYPIRFGLMRAVVPPWRKGGLDPAEVTLPQVLAKAGYKNRGVFGKWHLGHSSLKYHPLRRGFTEFVGHYNGAIDYFSHEREGELDWHHNYDSNHDKGYSTDLIAEAATRFINRSAKADSPFFCYVPFNSPHSPLQAKPDDLKAYKDLAAKNSIEQNSKKTKTGRKRKTFGQGNRTGYGQQGRGASPRQTLAAMISSMDTGVGRILDALDRNGVSNNTLVWFFSDNGGTGTAINRPLRGAKGSVFEGGIHVVAALRWPERIPAGGKITAPLGYIDVLPTLMRVTGVKDHGGKPLDGIDAFDVLMGKKKTVERDMYSYIGQQGEQTEKITLIEMKWKLVVNGLNVTKKSPGKVQRQILLFDIDKDPNETTNRANEQPQVVERMFSKLKSFRALQPANAVPAYRKRDPNFKPPHEWKIAD